MQAIATHDRQLAGLQGQVTNPVAQNAISQARNRAAQTAQAAKAAGTSGNPNPNGKGQGSGPASPHPTPKP